MNYTKRIMIIAIFIYSFQFVSAQNNYTTHTLKQGESLSTLAQQYHTSVGDIMRINGMHANSKLVYGSQIKIPSAKNQKNSIQKESNKDVVKSQPSAIPENAVVHTVAKGETLFSISKQYHISVEQIKAWNHLANGNAKLGETIIVGSRNEKIIASSPEKQTAEPLVVWQEKKDTVTNMPAPTVSDSEEENEKTEVQPELPAENNSNVGVEAQPAADYSGEGFFATQFKEKKNKNMQNISGVSKTFKTASGWADGKYYILANNIEPGTIVKITTDNGSTVYAKVLWNMGNLKENDGIDFRISNATAAALHLNEPSFTMSVSF